MSMKATDVRTVLEKVGLPVKQDPNGFLLPATVCHGYAVGEDCRIRCGSGIAGRGDVWSLVEVRSGERIGIPCSRRSDLARVLREWLAGPKPIFPGKWYATRSRTKFDNASYVWTIRNWKEARP
jgi:hypothetical protein